MSKIHRLVEVLSLFVCLGCQVYMAYLLFTFVPWWMVCITLPLGYIAADLVCGTVHWLADRYGDENTPFFGPCFIGPFRNHHVNPKDILGHDVITTNGNTCTMVAPVLIGACVLPIETITFFGLSFIFFLCSFSMLSNEFHKWAHMENPPIIIGFLQKYGLVLTTENHDVHHISPHDTYYCITAGWFNPFLDRIRFFDRAEHVIERVTGIKPNDEN